MKRRIQCIKVRLPDGREGEFWGAELVRDSELRSLNLSAVSIHLCRANDVEMGEKPVLPKVYPYPKAFNHATTISMNQNRQN